MRRRSANDGGRRGGRRPGNVEQKTRERCGRGECRCRREAREGEDNATEGAEATVSPSEVGGVPSSPLRGAYATRESHLRKQERDGELKWKVIKNDGSEESSRLLIALKNIFGKQLRNNAKEYIVRLVLIRDTTRCCA